jgi:hypothetical protein
MIDKLTGALELEVVKEAAGAPFPHALTTTPPKSNEDTAMNLTEDKEANPTYLTFQLYKTQYAKPLAVPRQSSKLKPESSR